MNGESVAVVVDVFRAFTTAAVAFDCGAQRIICVRELDQARALRTRYPNALLMGEDLGLRPAEFDLGNSPAAASQLDLSDRVVIQRTSNGTKGLIEAETTHVLAASAVVASATIAHVSRALPDADVEFVATRPGGEDQACIDFMSSLLQGDQPDPDALVIELRSIAADSVSKWADRLGQEHPEVMAYAADVAMCCDVDCFDTAMVGNRTSDGVELRAV